MIETATAGAESRLLPTTTDRSANVAYNYSPHM